MITPPDLYWIDLDVFVWEGGARAVRTVRHPMILPTDTVAAIYKCPELFRRIILGAEGELEAYWAHEAARPLDWQPSKTPCFLKILGRSLQSAAEGRDSDAPNITFYNDISDFPGHCVKTTSFYNELCVSKHTCFIVIVCACAKHRILRWSSSK